MNSPAFHPVIDTQGHTTRSETRGLLLSPDSHGWSRWAWQEKAYLVAHDPGSLASFDFVIHPPVLTKATQPVPDNGIASPKIALSDDRLPPTRPEWPTTDRLDPQDTTTSFGLRKRADGPAGSVSIGYQRSATYGLGSVWCWVDDDTNDGELIDGWWEVKERNMGMWVVWLVFPYILSEVPASPLHCFSHSPTTPDLTASPRFALPLSLRCFASRPSQDRPTLPC